MDIHKPKPSHSLREFLSELFTVTIGILIALSLDAALEQYRIDRQIEYAREDFRVELGYNRSKLAEDLKTSQATEVALSKIIHAGRALLAHQPPLQVSTTMTRTFVVLRSAAWTNAFSTQVMGHFPHEEARALAEAYSEQESFSVAEHDAQQQWFSIAGYVADVQDLSEAQLREGLHESVEAYAYLATLEDSERRLEANYDRALQAVGQ